jgi:hypothetical protein
LFAGSYPSYQLNWNVSSNQASANHILFSFNDFLNPRNHPNLLFSDSPLRN